MEINIHCHMYQHRLCWMLSSILQQQGDIPEIITSISFLPNHGNPTTESVIQFFREQGLKIIPVPINKGEEGNRAIARNLRAKNTQTDWMLYADSDMAYDTHFFEDLKKKIEVEPYKSEDKVIGADRHSMQIDFCVDYFKNDTRTYPCVVPNVADIVSKWPLWYIKGKGKAPGYFQLASVKAIKDKGGIYSEINIDKWRLCRTDRVFRDHMGGHVPIDLLPQYHLNHCRSDDHTMQR